MTGRNCKPRKIVSATLLGLLAFIQPVVSGEAEVIDVKTACNNQRLCSFDVTVKHTDTGWEHYADRWEVIVPDNEVIGTRVLHHPHVDEQPFTRRLSNVRIPDDVKKVIIRAHDSVHGYSKRVYPVEIR